MTVGGAAGSLNGEAAAPPISSPPVWEMALWSLLHPAQVAIVEACLWIEEPLSATLLVAVFDHDFHLNLVAYHVRRLGECGVLHEVSNRLVRGALEHLHRLATEPQPTAAYGSFGCGLAR